MAVAIPPDFNVSKQELDALEVFIRDQLKLRIVIWAKFRHAIHVGNKAANLMSQKGQVPPTVQEAYRELGKSHYEIVTSLGSARLSLDFAEQSSSSDALVFKKSYKDFYFHLGWLLDNLARLIYIVNDPQSDSSVYPRGPFQGKLVRHWIDWGHLRERKHRGYSRQQRSKVLREIINIRNAFTHGWTCPIIVDETSGTTLYWPRAIRTKRDYYWPYDEISMMKRQYRTAAPILQMMALDLAFVEEFQDRVFSKLARDIRKFEKHYDVVIV